MEYSYPRRNPARFLLVYLFIALVGSISCTLEPPPKRVPLKEAKISGGGVKVKVHSRKGLITGIVHEKTGFTFLDEPSDSLKYRVGIEIYDGLDGHLYSDLKDSTLVKNYEEKKNYVAFDRLFLNAPFQLDQQIEGKKEGIYISCRTAVVDDTRDLRTVRFSWLIPLPRGADLWIPGMERPMRLDGENSARFDYGPVPGGRYGIGIPLVSVWKPGTAGITVAVPLEIETARVIFEIESGKTPLGVLPAFEEYEFLKVTFDLAGIGGNRTLETGLWIYGHEDDWRPALGAFAQAYRDCFQASRRSVDLEGPLSRIDPSAASAASVINLKVQEISLAGINWNFFRRGEWVPPQAVRFSDFTWSAETDPGKFKDISAGLLRTAMDNLVLNKINPVLQSSFASSCGQETAEDNFSADIARDESGRPVKNSAGDYLMHIAKRSSFGKRMVEDQRQMIDLYPQAAVFYFPEWNVTGIDFAHDDSLTVVHNRPAYSLASNRKPLGKSLIDLVHDKGKLAAAEPASTIAEASGLDFFFLGDTSRAEIRRAAMMSLWRPVVADFDRNLKMTVEKAEQLLQMELIWGVLPSAVELGADQTLSRAYRPLFANLKGRDWVIEPHPVKLPKNIEGQIFMVPSAVHSGELDAVVAVVRPGARLADGLLEPGGTVRVAIPEAESYIRATWLPALRNAWPVPLKIVSEETEAVIELPFFGPAGVLRLSRR